MSKIKDITIDALGTGFATGNLGLLLIGFGFDTPGIILFAIGAIASAIGLGGVFLAGIAALVKS